MNANVIQEQKLIEGVLLGLMKSLENLAPHPDAPHRTGPLFAAVDSQHYPAAEYDGMGGSLMLEGFLSTAFTSAAGGFDWGSLIDSASEFIKDRTPGTQGFALHTRRAIADNFNRESMLGTYFADLPRRLGIERFLAHYQRRLYALRKQALLMGYSL